MSKTNEKYGLPLRVITSLTAIIKRHPAVKEVILYGSRAKGNYQPGSDIDLCLIAPLLTLQEQSIIENELDDLLLPWKIDLSVKHKIESQELLEHIDRVGILL
ncbi:MAG: hypothetical protein A3F18_06410 [Legionellales bacterium RIFCSPHIGHO2_12_FULL_37_14]|nr:MAG: hypothetical protein A3F18_06410 [Legionellales bacterium RIFCSPHIGHO2_12_FULL_37_14]